MVVIFSRKVFSLILDCSNWVVRIIDKIGIISIAAMQMFIFQKLFIGKSSALFKNHVESFLDKNLEQLLYRPAIERLRQAQAEGHLIAILSSSPDFLVGPISQRLGVEIGKSSFWLMILASSIYLGVALSLGLLISVVTKSQLVANQMAILITYLPSLLLSNFVFPIVNMPVVLQKLTRVVPATYFIDILNGLYLRNIGLKLLWPSYLVLVGMFGFLCVLNLIVLKREGL